jgi:hypothetical protein
MSLKTQFNIHHISFGPNYRALEVGIELHG